MRELPAAFSAMAAYRQWMIYKAVPSQVKPGKTDKFPVDFRSGCVVSAHDAQYWTDAPTAIAAAAQYGQGYGVAFVFTEVDPFWFLDIDGALEGSDWSPLSKALVQALPGAAVEVSQSGRGLHIFGSGHPPAHSCKNIPLGLEFYHAGRFVALTGYHASGDAGRDFSALLPSLVHQFFPPKAGTEQDAEWTDGPCQEWRGPEDDEELLRRMLRSQSARAAFGTGASFADLWTCNVDALARAYPPDASSSYPYDASSADAALAQHLAFWTGKDCERIKRLMLRSGLVRDKWSREDYLDKFTIPNACRMQREVLTDKEPEPLAGSTPPPFVGGDSKPPRAAAVTGSTFLTLEQQVDLFAGCVYVRDLHRVLVPGGALLKPEQFKVTFGGYTFPLDAANEKVSRDAWEAFTQNQAFRSPRADAPCFRPDLPPASLVEKDGQTLANTYWPVETPRQVGDAGPFLRHLAKVLPNERDRQILLCYMAAVVQHKGVKFPWCPLLQGVEGNGKTLFTRCVAFAIGDRYTYFPKASDIADKFNDWLYGSIFIGVEDIYVPESRAEVMEELKPMITGDRQQIQGKGKDKVTLGICCNFMLNSNHKDALRKHKNDRRFAMFYSAQQRVEDLERDGMGGDYFPKLYDWLRAGGYAIVSELLHTYPIPDELNPATACQRAPLTTSTEAAIAASMGGVEQEILEAIEQGLPGFCGGWISSMMLDRLMERLGVARRVTLHRRKDMLAHLGYEYHPALTDGRVNNMVLPDAGKPRLFARVGSPAWQLPTAAAVATAYQDAQTPKVGVPAP